MENLHLRTRLSTLSTAVFAAGAVTVLKYVLPLAPNALILTTATYVGERVLVEHGWDRPMGLCCLLISGALFIVGIIGIAYQSFALLACCGWLGLGLGAILVASTACVGYRRWTQGYAVFLSLGRGGTPYNALGYTVVSFKALFGIDPLSLPDIPKGIEPQAGFLGVIPRRPGSRPMIAGVAPQRQIDQRSDFSSIQWEIDAFVKGQAHLCQDTSFLERHGVALFPRDRYSARESERIFGSEIGHVHEYDGSIHLNLHPADVTRIIESGWGERHPLARGDEAWFAYFRDFWRFWGYADARPPVSVGWTLVYAPRDEMEREIVMRMVNAASCWMTGIISSKTNEPHQNGHGTMLSF